MSYNNVVVTLRSVMEGVREGHTLMGVRGVWGGLHVSSSLFVLFLGIYYWGCARGFGRGTLYMKWGQQNQRFGTMRLRGEKDEEEKERENMIKYKM